MIKAVVSWILVAAGSLLSGTAGATVFTYLYREAKMRFAVRSPISALISPPPTVPDAVGVDIPWLHVKFMTNAWVLPTAIMGIGLLVVAVGLHLRYLHRLDVGQEQLAKMGM